MKAAAALAFLLIAIQSRFTTEIVPDFLVGQWIVGEPFYDMSPQPIGINVKQEHKIIGAKLLFKSNSVLACGLSIRFLSLETKKYSADQFLQAYRITPNQIGLEAPVIDYSFTSSGLTAVCGSPEAFEIIGDGKNAVLEVANDYLHLNKLKISK